MEGRTISFVKGKGSLRHNNRDFIADNVDPERTKHNITYIKMSIEEAYERCFGDALREYNAGQKRKDRRKENYIEEIKHSGNGEQVFYENVVQIGTMKDTPVVNQDGSFTLEAKEAARVLHEYVRTFQKRNPNLFLFNAVLHLDEATPHLHLDYIPVAHGYKRGLKTRNSLTKALQEMGFEKGKGRKDNETIDWQHREREYIGGLCVEHGIEVAVIGVERDDYSLPEYKAIMGEVAQKEEELAEVKQELSSYELTQDVMDAVGKEVEAKLGRAESRVVSSRNPLDKEQYVKVPKKLWDQMLSAYGWASRRMEALRRLSTNVETLKAKVSRLEKRLALHGRFLEENGLQELFDAYLSPKKKSVLGSLQEKQIQVQEQSAGRNHRPVQGKEASQRDAGRW